MQQLPFPIIDPHIHQWDPYNTPHAAAFAVKLFGKYPKLLDKMVRLLKPKDVIETIGLTEHLTAPYLPANYNKDLGHYEVEQIVHVEASWHDQKGTGVVDETRFVAGLSFDQHNIQLGDIVATADPRQKNFKQLIQLHREASPKFRGIRKMAAVHPDKGIHAWVYSSQIADVTALAKAFPDTPIVLDHLGTPAGLFGKVGKATGKTEQDRAQIFSSWQDQLAELSECRNVSTKMSGLFMPVLGHDFHQQKRLATKQELLERAAPLIQHTLDCFGSERLMFASNFPMDSVSSSLMNIIDAFSDIVQDYDENALKPVFYENAKAFYKL